MPTGAARERQGTTLVARLTEAMNAHDLEASVAKDFHALDMRGAAIFTVEEGLITRGTVYMEPVVSDA